MGTSANITFPRTTYVMGNNEFKLRLKRISSINVQQIKKLK